MVQHLIVDAPEEKLLVDYENQPGLRIPMSLGKVKEDHDKSNQWLIQRGVFVRWLMLL